jgi:hypothetical protein
MDELPPEAPVRKSSLQQFTFRRCGCAVAGNGQIHQPTTTAIAAAAAAGRAGDP